MQTIIISFVGVIVLLAGVSMLWRVAARRWSLPCPSWLAWLVEDAVVEAVVGPMAGSRVILDRAKVTSGMRVLDAGCGPGRLTVPAAEAVGPDGQVVALDVQRQMLEKVQRRAEKRRLSNIRTILGKIGGGLLEHNAFDRAILVTVLGEIPEKEQVPALREILLALKPGGILSVTEIFPDPHYQNQSTVLGLAKAAGFEVKEVFGNWLAFTVNSMRSDR
jgi:ubiquinone/menaquinone biosynthesis C-methylase UbiE